MAVWTCRSGSSGPRCDVKLVRGSNNIARATRCQAPSAPSPADPALAPGRLADTIGYQLRLAQIAAYRAFEGGLTRQGVAPRYLGLLGIIEAHPGQPQSRLAEAVQLKRSSLVPIIDRLEGAGLVERRASPEDRRYKSVWLTAKGARVVRDLTVRAELAEARLSAGMTQFERRTLRQLLARVVGNLAKG